MCLITIINLRIVYYKMNDTISLLLATAVLAVGGVGLYLYKSIDDLDDGGKKNDDYDEDIIFNAKDEDEGDIYTNENKTKSRISKTKRNKKVSGTKRRY